MEQKAQLHILEVKTLTTAIEEKYESVMETMKHKIADLVILIEKARSNYQKLMTSVDVANDVVLECKNRQFTSKNDQPEPIPTKPVFKPLQKVPYCHKLPTVASGANVDALGKPKKPLPQSNLKTVLESIQKGEWDNKPWDFKTYFPSNSQISTLFKAIAKRKEVLDIDRANEIILRKRVEEDFNHELKLWEHREFQRIQSLNIQKKNFRKAYLHLDLNQEKADRLKSKLELLEEDLKNLTKLQDIHIRATERFKVARVKLVIENDRLTESIDCLHRQLVMTCNARVRALELPKTAFNKISFEHLCEKSEEILRCLRFEVLDIRERLVNEGSNLRKLLCEEFVICKNEFIRCNLFQKYTSQMMNIDKIIIHNTSEIVDVYKTLEDLIMLEADNDDNPIEGTENLNGFRYILTEKQWNSPDVLQCQNKIKILEEKSQYVEEMGKSSLESQKYLLESLTAQWKTTSYNAGEGESILLGVDIGENEENMSDENNMALMKENNHLLKVNDSEYNRMLQLQYDIIQWVGLQQKKLSTRENIVNTEVIDLRLQIAAMQQQLEEGYRVQEYETSSLANNTIELVDNLKLRLIKDLEENKTIQTKLETCITALSKECQIVREQQLKDQIAADDRVRNLFALISSLQSVVATSAIKLQIAAEEKDTVVISSKLAVMKARQELKIERMHCANLMFVIHSQRGVMSGLRRQIKGIRGEIYKIEEKRVSAHMEQRRELWEHIFAFSRLGTDVNYLFEFFAARLANLAGSRANINEDLAKNGASYVFAALCQSPRPLIRKHATRALAGFGWNGYVETRVLMWDCAMYWKAFTLEVIEKEKKKFVLGLSKFEVDGDYNTLLRLDGKNVDEFIPSSNMGLREIIKQRRQWALRATRRLESPNIHNQKLLNVKDGIIPSLLRIAVEDGNVDWEIARNAALALSIASYEIQNHADIIRNDGCINLIVKMCNADDPEVKMYAAITIANLSHKDENAQNIFGDSNAIPELLRMCYADVVDLLEATTSALSNLTCYSDKNCRLFLENDGLTAVTRILSQTYSENLLDGDQNDEVQANCSEVLANVSRFNGDMTAEYFNADVITTLV